MTEKQSPALRRGRAQPAGMTPRRLAGLLVVLFVALAVPAAALVWLGFRQLDLESFRQQQILAEGLVTAIDRRLAAAIAREQSRPANEYSFALQDGPSASGAGPDLLQRSPLSSLPPINEIPGTIGYFQVDREGALSTPLLPAGDNFARYGLDNSNDIAARRAIANRLTAVLVDNRLINRSQQSVPLTPPAEGVADTGIGSATFLPSENVASAEAVSAPQGFDDAVDGPDAAGGVEPDPGGARAERQSFTAAASADPDSGPGQAAFDRLAVDADEARGAAGPRAQPAASEGRRRESAPAAAVIAVPETAAAAAAGVSAEAEQKALAEQVVTTGVAADPARVSAFDSELEPMAFSRLDTGHFVLFRNAWHDGARDVQGLLIDDAQFIAAAFSEPFAATPLAEGVTLEINVAGTAARVVPAEQAVRPILRTRLSPPLADIELEFVAAHLPGSPIRGVLIWSAIALFTVLLGGIYAIYRFGLQQMQLARQQRTFVSAVSHELKTPLTSIRMYGEMLRAGWAGEAKKREYYDFIFAESERLSRLIDNVLTLARIDRGNVLALEDLSVGEVLDMIRSKTAAAVDQAGFTLTVDCQPTVAALEIRADADALAQIFINLVDNATKFAAASEQREIVLSACESSDDRVVLSVRDFGPGVGGKDLQRLFELFYRPDNELTRTTTGTGIGLALVRQLAGQMGARVDARNASPGAVFSVSLTRRHS